MKKHKWAIILTLSILLTVLIAACDSTNTDENSDQLPTLAATVANVETSVETEVVTETEEITETEEVAETQEVTGTEEVMQTPEVEVVTPEVNAFNTSTDSFTFIIDRARVTETANREDAPDGFQWILINASVTNNADTPVTISQDELIMLDTEGNQYLSGEMQDNIQPALVGTTLETGGSIYGLAIFALPEDAQPAVVEWCPGGTCSNEPLKSPVVLRG